MVKASLARLLDVKIDLVTNWKDKRKGNKTYRDKKERHWRILIDYTIRTREETTPEHLLTPKERAEHDRLRAASDWKEPRPTSIEYRFHPDLVRDFKREGGIGMTYMPVLKTLQLRRKFGRSRTATLLLFHVRRQLGSRGAKISTSLEDLCRALNLDTNRPGRTAGDLIRSLNLLKEANVILDFTLTGQAEDKLRQRLTIFTNPDWPYGRSVAADAAPLPSPKPSKPPKANDLGNRGRPKAQPIP